MDWLAGISNQDKVDQRQLLSVLVFCLLSAAIGFLLNLYPIELFSELTLIAGPALSILVALSISPLAGALVSVVVSSALIVSWHHIFGFLLFVPEAFVVGWLFRKGWNELLAVTFYWLILAVPFVVYMVVVKELGGLGFDVAGKYLLNAFLYTLIASAILWFFSIPKRLKLKPGRQFNLRTQVFTILMVSMTLPIVAAMLQLSKSALASFKERSEKTLQSYTEQARQVLDIYLENSTFVVRKHAELLSLKDKEDRYSNLQLREYQKQNPEFISMFIVNDHGEVESYTPIEQLPAGRPDISDREYFRQAINGNLYMSQALRGRAYGFPPIVTISAPIWDSEKQRVEDVMAGSLDLSAIGELIKSAVVLTPVFKKLEPEIIITDQTDKLIFSTTPLKIKMLDRLHSNPIASRDAPGFFSVDYIEDEVVEFRATTDSGWVIRGIFTAKKFNLMARTRYHRLSALILIVIIVVGILAAFISAQLNGPISWLLKRTVELDISKEPLEKQRYLSPYIPSEMSELVRAYESAERRLRIAFEAEKLQQQKAISAERASQEKSLFVSSMSHELRTPLNAILGFCQLLRQEPDLSPDVDELSNEIYLASQHLMLLLTDILDLSKIESGKLELKIEDIDLVSIVEDCIKMMSEQAKISSILLETELPESAVFVKADRLKLKQIVLNLLSNAIKYNRPNGKVTVAVRTKENNGRAVIRITDNGVGISEEKLEHLFQLFERLGQENQDIDGYGIGLAVSKKLTEAMNGQIHAQSELGVGSCFEVSLQKVDTLRMRAKDKSSSQSFEISPCRVLYVEDNEVNAIVMAKAMSRYPEIYFVREPDGKKGLERLSQETFDFVLLDISLPDISGFDILKKMQQEYPNAYSHVFAVSANALAEDIKKGMEAGFDEYITKPVRFDILFRSIEKRQHGRLA
ncbi:ATP-binding protein [Aliikangiella sp. G2MR2-5]|uniref:ATP-binding protein n=1 Tax=Aliikangiella sp. G2MR2-5 TaxID=2788943 RepID=UPI0018A8BFFA|nr:ATP-binding protein [Aliikangiella sp. G2MR2-5]